MKKVLTIISLFIAAILIGGGIGFYQIYEYHHKPPTIKIEKAPVLQAPMQYFNDYFSNKKSISILCTGNVAANITQLQQSYVEDYETFHFEDEFQYMQSYFDSCSYICGNLASALSSLEKEKTEEASHGSSLDITEAPVIQDTQAPSTEALLGEDGTPATEEDITEEPDDGSYDMGITEIPSTQSSPANGKKTVQEIIADLGLSGQGKFVAPPSFADALSTAGFSLLNTANANTLDNGIAGISSTIEGLSRYGIWTLGTYEVASDATCMAVADVESFKIGFTGYTNSIHKKLNEDYAYSVDYLDHYSPEAINAMCNRIKKTKAECDFVISFLVDDSTGKSTTDSDFQIAADEMIKAGSDIILGIQGNSNLPMEKRTVTLEDGSQKTGYIFYSLGDFISSEPDKGLSSKTGTMVKLTLTKSGEQTCLSGIDVLPVYTYQTKEKTGVISILDALNASEETDSLFGDEDKKNIVTIYKNFMNDFTSIGKEEFSEIDNWFHIDETP